VNAEQLAALGALPLCFRTAEKLCYAVGFEAAKVVYGAFAVLGGIAGVQVANLAAGKFAALDTERGRIALFLGTPFYAAHGAVVRFIAVGGTAGAGVFGPLKTQA